jgi:hypothetical protein
MFCTHNPEWDPTNHGARDWPGAKVTWLLWDSAGTSSEAGLSIPLYGLVTRWNSTLKEPVITWGETVCLLCLLWQTNFSNKHTEHHVRAFTRKWASLTFVPAKWWLSYRIWVWRRNYITAQLGQGLSLRPSWLTGVPQRVTTQLRRETALTAWMWTM